MVPLVVFREEETKFVEEFTKLLEEGIRKEMGLAFEEGGGGVELEEGEDPGSEGGTALEICGTEGGCADLGA